MGVLTYGEYELLCQSIDAMVMSMEIFSKKDDGDIVAMAGFMFPQMSDDDAEHAVISLRENSDEKIKSLKIIREKLKELI